MILKLDFSADTPIYIQIRNQIVVGIADGSLAQGQQLPTIRALAAESGINMMTVSKAYQLLKQEGYIETDRRSGATILKGNITKKISDQAMSQLRVIVSEAKLSGVTKDEFLEICSGYFDDTEVQ